MPREKRRVKASIITWFTLLIIWITAGPLPKAAQTWEKPGIMSARERTAVLYGYFLHEPGPLIWFPRKRKDKGPRGEVKQVENSTFTVELSATRPIPEWDGKGRRFGLEEMVFIGADAARFMDGRQTKIHLVK